MPGRRTLPATSTVTLPAAGAPGAGPGVSGLPDGTVAGTATRSPAGAGSATGAAGSSRTTCQQVKARRDGDQDRDHGHLPRPQPDPARAGSPAAARPAPDAAARRAARGPAPAPGRPAARRAARPPGRGRRSGEPARASHPGVLVPPLPSRRGRDLVTPGGQLLGQQRQAPGHGLLVLGVGTSTTHARDGRQRSGRCGDRAAATCGQRPRRCSLWTTPGQWARHRVRP